MDGAISLRSRRMGPVKCWSLWAATGAGRIGPQWSVRGPAGMALETAAVADDGVAALLYLKGSGLPGQALMLEGASGVLHQWSRQAFTPAGTPVVADLEGDGRVEVVVQTATRDVLCLQAPGEGGGEPRPAVAGAGLRPDQ